MRQIVRTQLAARPGHSVTFASTDRIEDDRPVTLWRMVCSCGAKGFWHDSLLIARKYGRQHVEDVHG